MAVHRLSDLTAISYGDRTHGVNAWVQIAVSYSAITLLGWEMILVRGCENVAGKLRQE